MEQSKQFLNSENKKPGTTQKEHYDELQKKQQQRQ